MTKKWMVLIHLIPVCLMAQNMQVADTLYAKNGRSLGCMVRQLDQENSQILYLHNQIETTIALSRIDKIRIGDLGIVFTTQTGFTQSIDSLNVYFQKRNKISVPDKKKRTNPFSQSRLGIGLLLAWEADIDSYDLYSDKQPATLTIPFDVTQYIRIEPEFLFYRWSMQEGYYHRRQKQYKLGVGFFGKHTISKLLVYYGIRAGYEEIRTEIEYKNYEKRKGLIIKRYAGPIIGGEYCLDKHFSLGGEIGFRLIHTGSRDSYFYSAEKSSLDDDNDDKGNVQETVSAIFIRFYF